ncbi:hypothetical protein QZH56_03380 [Streptomyces olivoreticuli]|uniref:hypothetical protein n=1 Tax=Streptomyces olivoreticuli TaxID=68246 RepID=UPI0026596D8A|nr:hypothetical protein [Streptomyces olivoreticuli]WKK27338.1 hypothetical protein QZH56_03380 [Streptomyces olivoreticuli]
MPRLRIQRAIWPRPALILTDTPRPDCRICEGVGGIEYDYGHPETGEYAGTDWEPCSCWNETRRWLLLPLPRLPRRHRTVRDPRVGGYSDEPPF